MFFIIAFSGKIGSGKSSISKLIAEKFNFQRVSFGDYVRKIATERDIEHTRINLQNLGEFLLAENSYQFCLNVLNQASTNNSIFLVVDGIRHQIALDEIKKIVHPNDVFHVHLEINEEIRLERINKRQSTSTNDIIKIDNHPSEIQVTSVLSKMADIVLNTDDTEENLIEVLSLWLVKQI